MPIEIPKAQLSIVFTLNYLPVWLNIDHAKDLYPPPLGRLKFLKRGTLAAICLGYSVALRLHLGAEPIAPVSIIRKTHDR